MMISVQNVIQSYAICRHPKNVVYALRECSLEIPENCFACILGPSGSGKSSLLKVLSGMQPFDSGTVHVAGKDIFGLKKRKTEEGKTRTLKVCHPAHRVTPFYLVLQRIKSDWKRMLVLELVFAFLLSFSLFSAYKAADTYHSIQVLESTPAAVLRAGMFDHSYEAEDTTLSREEFEKIEALSGISKIRAAYVSDDYRMGWESMADSPLLQDDSLAGKYCSILNRTN